MSKLKHLANCLRALADVLEEEDVKTHDHGPTPSNKCFASLERDHSSAVPINRMLLTAMLDAKKYSTQDIEGIIMDLNHDSKVTVILVPYWQDLLKNTPNSGLLVTEL